VNGEYDEAHHTIEDGIAWLKGRQIGGGPLETWLMMAQARNLARRGELDHAMGVLDRVRQRGLGSPIEYEAVGFYEAADAVGNALRQSDAAESRRLLNELPHDPTDNVMFEIKRLVLTSAVYELESDRRSAVTTLAEAIELAQAGYRFQFTFAGPLIEGILQRMIGRTKHDDFIHSLIRHMPAEAVRTPEQPIDPLADREIDVLAEIAAGYTNEEIAERLFISRGTVKRHASNIYLKLGVHHRAEAAARGRELGLIQ
jgi:ATP/maltotriose-dependent transcriptional regulator MalT